MYRIIVFHPERLVEMYTKKFPRNVSKDTCECALIIDGVQHQGDDFVAVISDEFGNPKLFYNTDVLTLGMAMKMIAVQFVKLANETCSKQDLEDLANILGDSIKTLEEK